MTILYIGEYHHNAILNQMYHYNKTGSPSNNASVKFVGDSFIFNFNFIHEFIQEIILNNEATNALIMSQYVCIILSPITNISIYQKA